MWEVQPRSAYDYQECCENTGTVFQRMTDDGSAAGLAVAVRAAVVQIAPLAEGKIDVAVFDENDVAGVMGVVVDVGSCTIVIGHSNADK
eukprot:gene368-biopygen6013